jgi:homocysteine S-methyltransferase
MASYARRFILNGVKLVGGCCGTTPEHIRAIKMAVRASAPVRTPAPPVHPGARLVAEAPAAPQVDRAIKSRLSNAIARGKFVVAVQLLPPKGFASDQFLDQARMLRILGADVVIIPDGPRATARMSALSAAVLAEQQAGIETVLQYSCRDRNLLGMQSDLLGAHAMGIRNLLIVTGDPPRLGDYPDATAVFDVDSIGLTNVVSRLNRGQDIGGQAIGEPTAFYIGVAANPGAPNLGEEIRRFNFKVEAGAEFAVTQPIFDIEAFDAFRAQIAGANIPVIAGLTPIDSLRHAEFLANEVPGVRIPDPIMERIQRAGGAEAVSAEGIAIAREIAAELRGRVQGLQIVTSAAGIAGALALLEDGAVTRG